MGPSAITGLLRQPRIAALCLAAVTFLAFWPVSEFGYISFDDPDYVTKNPRVLSGLNADNIVWAFTTFHAQNWHPLTWLSLMADAQIIGPDAAALHLINLLWHVANSVLLFVVLRRLTDDFGPSLFVASIFALHPLHVESVAWISERKDVLSMCFLLLTIWAWGRYAGIDPKSEIRDPKEVRSPKSEVRTANSLERSDAGSRTRMYALALGLFALGLMSKPMLVTTPFLLLLLDYWPLNRFDRVPFFRLVFEKLPFFVLSGFSSVITFVAQQQGGAVRTLEHFPLEARLGNAVVSYAAYLKKTVWPAELSIFCPHPGHWPAREILLSILVLAVISAAAFALRRRAPFFLFGWCWFLGTLVPVLGIVQVGIQAMADRYTYVPLIGVFVAVAWGARALLEARPRFVGAVTVLALSVVIASAVVTRKQLQYWRNDETVFRHAVAVNPENPLAQNNLADALLREGRGREAIPHYREVIRLNPAYAHAYNNLGAALVTTGQPDEALPFFERAVRLDPRFSEARLNLGDALAARGRREEAIQQYRSVLQWDPNSVPALVKLARVAAETGKPDEALGWYQRALQAAPLIPAVHIELGKLLDKQGRAAEALAQFAEAVRLDSEDPETHLVYGEALLRQGKRAEAAAQFQETLRLKPGHPQATEQLRQAGL